MTFVIESKL
ncbi:CPXV039 protein [Cowpox virus]|uniref:CPXV039 protein n=1 Tax=Cowpox virus TaxID=10243 RepID=U5TKT6_COWPX|nr:CPXV039 protein [Cowpox virus]AGY97452.1 CPXV039 protein [Cowpox virus]AGY98104.1 CPXV039 protein [Cowpox virus]AGY98527.1 CPXV039 protein [Cowpox virus]AGY98742.1 CPXV039 protein [Cowpox virus]